MSFWQVRAVGRVKTISVYDPLYDPLSYLDNFLRHYSYQFLQAVVYETSVSSDKNRPQGFAISFGVSMGTVQGHGMAGRMQGTLIW